LVGRASIDVLQPTLQGYVFWTDTPTSVPHAVGTNPFGKGVFFHCFLTQTPASKELSVFKMRSQRGKRLGWWASIAIPFNACFKFWFHSFPCVSPGTLFFSTVVETDEGYFVSLRKYRRGAVRSQHLTGKWVHCVVERQTGKACFTLVDSRDAATLQPILRSRVEPGTIVISDEWKSYSTLKDTFDHRTVNHSRGRLFRLIDLRYL